MGFARILRIPSCDVTCWPCTDTHGAFSSSFGTFVMSLPVWEWVYLRSFGTYSLRRTILEGKVV